MNNGKYIVFKKIDMAESATRVKSLPESGNQPILSKLSISSTKECVHNVENNNKLYIIGSTSRLSLVRFTIIGQLSRYRSRPWPA